MPLSEKNGKRLWIAVIFSLAGAGLVVGGTSWSSSIDKREQVCGEAATDLSVEDIRELPFRHDARYLITQDAEGNDFSCYYGEDGGVLNLMGGPIRS